MSAVFRKLQLKDHDTIVVLDAPSTFEAELAALEGVQVHRAADAVEAVRFALAFVTEQAALDAAIHALTTRAEGDVVLWFAYPKKSSKRLTCDFDRDAGWEALGEAGFEGVRSVAIDEDWSALRFRKARLIGTMTRDPKRAMSAVGKERTRRS